MKPSETALRTALPVFVVDDEPEICALVVEFLDELGLPARVIDDPEALPELVMTGQEAPIYRTLSFGVGGVAHVQKPFSLTTLRAAIGQALGT